MGLTGSANSHQVMGASSLGEGSGGPPIPVPGVKGDEGAVLKIRFRNPDKSPCRRISLLSAGWQKKKSPSRMCATECGLPRSLQAKNSGSE